MCSGHVPARLRWAERGLYLCSRLRDPLVPTPAPTLSLPRLESTLRDVFWRTRDIPGLHLTGSSPGCAAHLSEGLLSQAGP